jgi:hypothetical protein
MQNPRDPSDGINSNEVASFFNQVFKMIGDKTTEMIRDAGAATFRALVWRSPVMHGSYVNSHRIGINGKETGRPPINYQDRYPSGRMKSDADKEALDRELPVLKRITLPTETFVMSNDIEHAINVESLGWKNRHGGSPGRKVYTLTGIELRERILPALIKKYEKKIEESGNKATVSVARSSDGKIDTRLSFLKTK